MKCSTDKHSMQQQRKMIMMIAVVATLVTLLVTMTIAQQQQAFAAISLNSSKSNVYRSTQNAQPNEGGSVEQTSTNTCDCPSTDESITIAIEDTNTNTASIECGDDCDANINQMNRPRPAYDLALGKP